MFSLKNLSSQEVTECVPWDFKPTSKPEKITWNDTDVDHCFFAGVSGGSPSLRVSKNNPVTQIHAIVADYDADHSGEDLKAVVSRRSKTNYPPNYVCFTNSNGVRAVWLLKAPLPVTTATAKELMKRLSKTLKPASLFSGFDREAFTDVHKYYEVGRDWQNLHNDTISVEMMSQWLVEATQKNNWSMEGVCIPESDLRDRVNKLYPSKWPGSFEIGARGPRFWDVDADNETAAIVRESGMQCFTGSQSFVPWHQILGSKWVAEYEASQIAGATSKVFFDGTNYWVEGSAGWRCMNRVDAVAYLKVNCNLSSRADANGVSPVDNALVSIQDLQAVDQVVRLPATPSGIIHKNGKRELNTLYQPVISAVPGQLIFIEEYLHALFEERPLCHALTWAKYAWETGDRFDMRPGQTLFIVGPPGVGKTLFSTVLMSGLLGGSMDASSFLTGESNWNGPLMENALWTVDDVQALTSVGAHRRWNTMLKKFAANRRFTVTEKYRRDVSVSWNGRVIVTMNDDSQSLGMLPDLDVSNSDKVMILRTQNTSLDFTPDVADKIRAELPAFADYLKHWNPPEYCIAGGRYYASSYIEKDLLEESTQNATSQTLLEALMSYMDYMGMDEPLVGNATAIHGMLTGESSPVREGMRGVSPNLLGRQLGSLHAKYPKWISKTRSTHSRTWTISEELLK